MARAGVKKFAMQEKVSINKPGTADNPCSSNSIHLSVWSVTVQRARLYNFAMWKSVFMERERSYAQKGAWKDTMQPDTFQLYSFLLSVFSLSRVFLFFLLHLLFPVLLLCYKEAGFYHCPATLGIHFTGDGELGRAGEPWQTQSW